MAIITSFCLKVVRSLQIVCAHNTGLCKGVCL